MLKFGGKIFIVSFDFSLTGSSLQRFWVLFWISGLSTAEFWQQIGRPDWKSSISSCLVPCCLIICHSFFSRCQIYSIPWWCLPLLCLRCPWSVRGVASLPQVPPMSAEIRHNRLPRKQNSALLRHFVTCVLFPFQQENV